MAYGLVRFQTGTYAYHISYDNDEHTIFEKLDPNLPTIARIFIKSDHLPYVLDTKGKLYVMQSKSMFEPVEANFQIDDVQPGVPTLIRSGCNLFGLNYYQQLRLLYPIMQLIGPGFLMTTHDFCYIRPEGEILSVSHPRVWDIKKCIAGWKHIGGVIFILENSGDLYQISFIGQHIAKLPMTCDNVYFAGDSHLLLVRGGRYSLYCYAELEVNFDGIVVEVCEYYVITTKMVYRFIGDRYVPCMRLTGFRRCKRVDKDIFVSAENRTLVFRDMPRLAVKQINATLADYSA